VGRLSGARLRVLVLALLAVAVGSAVYVLALKPEPGLYLELRLLRDGVDESPLLDRGDVVWCVFAEAVAPPTFKDDTAKLVWSCFKGRGAVKIPYEALKPVAEDWDRVSRDRGIDPSTFTFGLITRVIVGNASNGNVLYTATDSIPLNPSNHLQARAWRVELKLRKGSLLIESEARETLVAPKLAQPAAAEAEGSIQPTQTGYYKFVPIVIFRPENLTSVLPDYLKPYNGKTYMKTPILIIHNQASAAITSGVYIDNLRTLTVKLSVAIGDIISKIRSTPPILPSLTVSVSGTVWSSQAKFIGLTGTVCANSAKWVYVWGRPRLIVGQMYYCVGSSCQWVYDEIDASVDDVIVSNGYIDGDAQNGLPHSLIMNAFLYGTTERQLTNLPGTSLADGKLDVNESIYLGQIYQLAYNNVNIGITIDVGAIAAEAACSLLTVYPPSTPVCLAVLSAISVSVDYQADLHVDARLKNEGSACGENKSVYVYVRDSIYQYNVGGTSVKPPFGIYFRFQTVSP